MKNTDLENFEINRYYAYNTNFLLLQAILQGDKEEVLKILTNFPVNDIPINFGYLKFNGTLEENIWYALEFALERNQEEIAAILIQAGSSLHFDNPKFKWDTKSIMNIAYPNHNECRLLIDAIKNADIYPQEAFEAISSTISFQKDVLQFLFDLGGQDLIKAINSAPGHEQFIRECIKKEISFKFKHNQFILSSNSKDDLEEASILSLEAKRSMKVVFKDGKLFFEEADIIVPDTPENDPHMFILDKRGNLYINAYNPLDAHATVEVGRKGFLLNKPKPVALAGHLEVENGKITIIKNDSGHYTPNDDQLMLGAHYLYQAKVLDDNVEILFYDKDETALVPTDEEGFIHANLDDLEGIDPIDLLGKYSDLNY